MKKIKISQLPIYTSLKGLFTIGTDKDNRSVKVSLEFVEDRATEAASATKMANEATDRAVAATRNADTATANANAATSKAQTATANANNATTKANASAEKADTATANANVATAAANEAKKNADIAANNATTATNNANKATEDAKNATEQTIETLNRLIPTGLTVEAVERITLGNTALNRIRAILTPENTIPNIIFMSDNKAVRIDPQGFIRVVGKGASEVHIIPTCNTAIAKTIIIRVEDPTARLVDTRRKIRFTENGAIRLN